MMISVMPIAVRIVMRPVIHYDSRSVYGRGPDVHRRGLHVHWRRCDAYGRGIRHARRGTDGGGSHVNRWRGDINWRRHRKADAEAE